jgi:hypothetical protein
MFVHTLVIAASEGGGHSEEHYKNHNEWFVGITVMIIFIILLAATMAFQKDK